MTELMGRTISKVEIKQRLGRGGMGDIYLGQHTTLNRPVALKILHSFLSEDPKNIQRFRIEARAVAALRHPNIVRVFDFDLLDGRPYFVMELVEGMPFDSYLKALKDGQRRLPPETVALRHPVEGAVSHLQTSSKRGKMALSLMGYGFYI